MTQLHVLHTLRRPIYYLLPPHLSMECQIPVSSRFVPTDVSYSDDSYPNLDNSCPISVGSYRSLWSICTLVNNNKKKAF